MDWLELVCPGNKIKQLNCLQSTSGIKLLTIISTSLSTPLGFTTRGLVIGNHQVFDEEVYNRYTVVLMSVGEIVDS